MLTDYSMPSQFFFFVGFSLQYMILVLQVQEAEVRRLSLYCQKKKRVSYTS